MQDLQGLFRQGLDFPAFDAELVQDLCRRLCCALAKRQRPGKVALAQHVGAATRRRQFMNAQGRSLGVDFRPSDARAGEERQVGVGAADGPRPPCRRENRRGIAARE